MTWFRRHLLALAVVAVALAATGAVFGFARPGYEKQLRMVKDEPLPYSKVLFNAAEVRRAFAAEGITLTPRSASATITTFGNRGDVLVVDIFGDPAKVKATGFYDVTIDAGGNYVHFPRSCAASDGTAAARWHGNVRVVVRCRVDLNGAGWMRRAQHALTRLDR
ncbi:MAG: hypothetical protein QOF45_2442 [Gaiellaceae bacterium]|jgi:hypothetical protein|nr:hypothetical protein [Gaiellaceae bacterium]